MNSQVIYNLFKQYRSSVQNMQKILVANSYLSISKGTRKVQKARKYRRPEELEDPFYYGIGPKEEVSAKCQSIAARGFAKEQPPYQPPTDIEDQLQRIYKKIFSSELMPEWKSQVLDDSLLKYKVLTKCMETFKKNIPNSYIHQMKNMEDVLIFFSTPIEGCLHYDALVRDSDKLPPNLHVMSETPSFKPDTDTYFGGITAYPGRKRLVFTKTGEKFEKTIEWPHM